MEKLTVEYLLLINEGESFCKDIKSFNSLLMSNSDIQILKGSNIKYKHDRSFDYSIKALNPRDKYRIFQLKFNSNIDDIEFFELLLRDVRKILSPFKNIHLEELINDISSYYSTKAYPDIYEIENLMRKLITKFMLINIGYNWADQSTPRDVKNSIKGNATEKSNYLQSVDFIQLSNYLFKEYPLEHPDNLIKTLKSMKVSEIKDNFFEELLERFVPKSNWEKYFSHIVDYKAQNLEKDWVKLYELRNKIAHSRFINRSDYNEIYSLIKKIKPVILRALDKIEEIHVTEEDKSAIEESILVNRGSYYKDFIETYNLANDVFYKLIKSAIELNLIPEAKRSELLKINNKIVSPTILAKELVLYNILTPNDYEIFTQINTFRNELIHGLLPDDTSQTEIKGYLSKLDEFTINLLLIDLKAINEADNNEK